MPLRYTHDFVCISTPFLFIKEQYSTGQIYHSFIYSLIEGHLHFSIFLAITNRVAINIHIQVLCDYSLISVKYTPRKELLGHKVRIRQTFFGDILYSHQHVKVQVVPHPHRYQVLAVRHFNEYEMVLHCGFNFYFTNG